jgi:hypothetical protein
MRDVLFNAWLRIIRWSLFLLMIELHGCQDSQHYEKESDDMQGILRLSL